LIPGELFECKGRNEISSDVSVTYLHNYKVDNGNDAFSRKDTENILIAIIKSQSTYTVTDLKEKKFDLPKPSSRYMTLLKKQTIEARKIKNNKYFKFDEEDNVIAFDKR
jgi:hypothetical protein